MEKKQAPFGYSNQFLTKCKQNEIVAVAALFRSLQVKKTQ